MFKELMKVEKAMNNYICYLHIRPANDDNHIKITTILGNDYVVNLDTIQIMNQRQLKEMLFKRLDIENLIIDAHVMGV